MACSYLTKAFVAGLAFPAIILPFLYTFLFYNVDGNLFKAPIQFIPPFIPLVFGLVNIICLWFGLGKSRDTKKNNLWLTGIIFGLLVAAFGVFKLQIPARVFGITGPLQYFPLILVPLFYGLIFRYIVNYFNELFGLNDF